jgi:hypothetical protein
MVMMIITNIKGFLYQQRHILCLLSTRLIVTEDRTSRPSGKEEQATHAPIASVAAKDLLSEEKKKRESISLNTIEG